MVDVSSGAGLVMAGGDLLYMLRPGAEGWRHRPPPEGLGAVLAVAAEPGPPFRYAVASEGGITLFGLPNDQMLTLKAQAVSIRVTHLAWGRLGEERVLYIRWDDRSVGRIRLDLGTIEDLHVLPMDALAADAAGVLAMAAIRGEGVPHVLVTEDGVRFEERDAVAAPEGESPVHLAVAGAAIACAIEGWGAYLSRGVDDAFVPCAGLGGGGPIAFHGRAPGAALFGACWERSLSAIHRVDAQGVTQRILELDSSGGDPPRVAALSWDETRRVLWSVSPQAGILKSEEPTGKMGEKRSLS
jgi:hypothetical protein